MTQTSSDSNNNSDCFITGNNKVVGIDIKPIPKSYVIMAKAFASATINRQIVGDKRKILIGDYKNMFQLSFLQQLNNRTVGNPLVQVISLTLNSDHYLFDTFGRNVFIAEQVLGPTDSPNCATRLTNKAHGISMCCKSRPVPLGFHRCMNPKDKKIYGSCKTIPIPGRFIQLKRTTGFTVPRKAYSSAPDPVGNVTVIINDNMDYVHENFRAWGYKVVIVVKRNNQWQIKEYSNNYQLARYTPLMDHIHCSSYERSYPNMADYIRLNLDNTNSSWQLRIPLEWIGEYCNFNKFPRSNEVRNINAGFQNTTLDNGINNLGLIGSYNPKPINELNTKDLSYIDLLRQIYNIDYTNTGYDYWNSESNSNNANNSSFTIPSTNQSGFQNLSTNQNNNNNQSIYPYYTPFTMDTPQSSDEDIEMRNNN